VRKTWPQPNPMMGSGFGVKPTIPTMSGSMDRNRDDERKWEERRIRVGFYYEDL
jgi:hypothetical protein